jgi:hypothetical protein
VEQLHLVIGLSASGKSTLLKETVDRFKLRTLNHVEKQDWGGWCDQPPGPGLRDKLFGFLRAGGYAAVDCAGFCSRAALNHFFAELGTKVPGTECRLTFFDNNPLRCIGLALADPAKRYRADGALARVSQILRDCPTYVPDATLGEIRPILPARSPILYQPGTDEVYDRALREVAAVLTLGGRRLQGRDFDTARLAVDKQDQMIESVRS